MLIHILHNQFVYIEEHSNEPLQHYVLSREVLCRVLYIQSMAHNRRVIKYYNMLESHISKRDSSKNGSNSNINQCISPVVQYTCIHQATHMASMCKYCPHAHKQYWISHNIQQQPTQWQEGTSSASPQSPYQDTPARVRHRTWTCPIRVESTIQRAQ